MNFYNVLRNILSKPSTTKGLAGKFCKYSWEYFWTDTWLTYFALIEIYHRYFLVMSDIRSNECTIVEL